jgi:hypothetical protein
MLPCLPCVNAATTPNWLLLRRPCLPKMRPPSRRQIFSRPASPLLQPE